METIVIRDEPRQIEFEIHPTRALTDDEAQQLVRDFVAKKKGRLKARTRYVIFR